MTERTTVRLPPALARSLKRTAAEEGTTMTALLEEGARYVVEERKSRKQKPRVAPRVSSVSGPPMTGGAHAEIARIKLVEELYDLEYVSRMNRGFR
jgi:hypothetical protein